MADVTLKQGVATEIRAIVPAIVHVLDVTDHAGGNNPYYQPGKGG
jgi:Fe/S biogenesis protein NfuA